jgi:hypothetical protein
MSSYDFGNIPAIIERHLSESDIRQGEREAIAQYLENLTQVRLPEVLRNCGFGDDESSDGWADMQATEKQLLKSIAAAIRNGAGAK